MVGAFPMMWNPAWLLMWLSLRLLMFTLQGRSATQPWTHQAMPPRPSRSHSHGLLTWEASHVGFIQTCQDLLWTTDALVFRSEPCTSIQRGRWALQELSRCAPLYMWQDPLLYHPGKGSGYQKLMTKLILYCFLALKCYLPPPHFLYFRRSEMVGVWGLGTHDSLGFLVSLRMSDLKFTDLGTHS